MTTDYAGRLIVHDLEMHLDVTDALNVGDTVEVIRGVRVIALAMALDRAAQPAAEPVRLVGWL